MHLKCIIIAMTNMKSRKSLFLGILIGASLAGLAGYLCIPLVAKQRSKPIILQQQKQINRQAEMIEYLRQNNLSGLLSNILQKVEEELKSNPRRELSEGTIDQIKALSYTFKPYKYVEGDSLSERKVSPERGQLLLMLSGMQMDSVSLRKILATTSFAGADLRGVDLEGVYLDSVDLNSADLQEAKMSGAHLQGANLRMTNLWAADLHGAHLKDADLTRADLSWADLIGSDMRNVNLHEADAVSAQLRQVDLQGAYMQWIDLSGAFLHQANVADTDMFRATLTRAQLVKTNLSGANLKYAIVSEANLDEAIFDGADLTNLIISNKDWLTSLDDWHISGAAEIRNTYKMIEAFSYEGSKYQLIKQ